MSSTPGGSPGSADCAISSLDANDARKSALTPSSPTWEGRCGPFEPITLALHPFQAVDSGSSPLKIIETASHTHTHPPTCALRRPMLARRAADAPLPLRRSLLSLLLGAFCCSTLGGERREREVFS